MAYTHLALEERYHICSLSVQGFGPTAIAAEVGRDKSTVSRELRRNRGQRGYRAGQAQQLSETRRRQAYNGPCVSPATWALAREHLVNGYSPQQIAGRMRRDGSGSISHETVYQRIYADKRAGGHMHTYLRCCKKRRKRYASGRNRRGRIPNRVGIEQRPKFVDLKIRVGDWEGDTIIGANQKQAIVSLVDRKTRYTLLRKVKNKTASMVSDAIIQELKRVDATFYTLTLDNGLEFSGHQRVTQVLGGATYFARPYHSWERGLNENTNGLVRQYIPKKRRLEEVDDDEIQAIEDELNHRPRKCLDYRTPHEALCEDIRRRKGVALQV